MHSRANVKVGQFMGNCKKRLTISNSYGTPNIGDEAILHAMCAYFSALGCEIEILSNTNGVPDRPPPPGVRSVLGGPLRVFDVVRSIRNSDLLIIGGGGIIQSATSLGNLLFHFSRAVIAWLVGTPFCLCGVGVGPIPHAFGRNVTRSMALHAQSVFVRDEASMTLLHELNAAQSVEVAADMAFAFPVRSRVIRKPSERLKVAVSLRPAIGNRRQRSDISQALHYGPMILEAVKMVGRRRDQDVDFVFVSMNAEQDDQIAHALCNDDRCNEFRVVTSGGERLETIVAQLQDVDIVIGMRLHSIILAALGGVPAIAICYDRKVREVMSRLGLESFALAPDEVTSAAIESCVIAFLDNRDEIVEGLIVRIQHLHVLACDALAKCVR